MENQPRCFLCFFKSSTNSLFPYQVFPPQSSVRWASFQQTQKRLFSLNFAEVFIFLFQVTGVVITYFTLLYQLEWGDILMKYRSVSLWTFFKFSWCVWTNKRQMDHYLLILVNICVEQWAETPWHIFLLTEVTLIGWSECLPRRFFFADNEMVMNCWPVMQSFWKLLYLEREQHWFFLLQSSNEAAFFEGDVAP